MCGAATEPSLCGCPANHSRLPPPKELLTIPLQAAAPFWGLLWGLVQWWGAAVLSPLPACFPSRRQVHSWAQQGFCVGCGSGILFVLYSLNGSGAPCWVMRTLLGLKPCRLDILPLDCAVSLSGSDSSAAPGK